MTDDRDAEWITEIDGFMKPEKKQASHAIQDVTGIGNTSAQAIISVIGTDMGRFPTDRHISSWAGLCPGDNESAKKRKSGKTRNGMQAGFSLHRQAVQNQYGRCRPF